MSRRLGYGRAVSDTAAQQITARLRLAGCVQIVIDRGTAGDPQPEWHKLRAALRHTDTLVLVTLPAPGKHRAQVLAELQALSSANICRVEILPGARLTHPGQPDETPAARTPQLSAGQLYRYRRPNNHRPATP